jgi:hypothetical protein
MVDMKLHELIAEINFQEKQVSDWSGEEHANLLFNVLDILMAYVDAEVELNPTDFETQKFYRARTTIEMSLTAISNLIANAPYSKLQDARIISKRNLEVLEEKFNQTQMMFDRLKDCSIATEMRIQKTKVALEQVNERLQ